MASVTESRSEENFYDIPDYSRALRAVETSPTLGPPSPCIKLRVCVKGRTGHVRCIPDTGSDITVMSLKVLGPLGIGQADLVPPPAVGLDNPDGTPLSSRVLGAVHATMSYGPVSIKGWITVLSSLPRSLLSWRHAQQLRMIPQDYPLPIQPRVVISSIGDRQSAAVDPTTPPSHQDIGALATPSPPGAESVATSLTRRPIPRPWERTDIDTDRTLTPRPRAERNSDVPAPRPMPPPPSSALSPTEARTAFLEEYQDVLLTKADFCEGKTLRALHGPPMRIYVKEDVTPFAIHTPRAIPLAWREDVRRELEAMVRQGIITPVGEGPSDWCHPLVVVAKPKGGVRITVDLTKLNSQVRRPTHPPCPNTSRSYSPCRCLGKVFYDVGRPLWILAAPAGDS